MYHLFLHKKDKTYESGRKPDDVSTSIKYARKKAIRLLKHKRANNEVIIQFVREQGDKHYVARVRKEKTVMDKIIYTYVPAKGRLKFINDDGSVKDYSPSKKDIIRAKKYHYWYHRAY